MFGDEAIVTLTPSPTPTPGLCASDCNNNSAVSINELVGKLDEWVADWGNRASTCANWDAAHGNDLTCVGGNGTGGIPDALFPGGDFRDGSDAGVFAAFSDGPSPHRHP